MRHLDLFSGIGGFAYAADQVWGEVEHTFCDNDDFCKAVLRKHWPESDIYDGIRQLIADAKSLSWRSGARQEVENGKEPNNRIDLLTGGFPCQPFSHAGVRRGTSDDRYLWPEMLRVIRLAKPAWVIAENVGGLISWNEGLVLETVCADLEAEGYEVQPFVIPAAAVNAPHRRDRVWIVANAPDYQRNARLGLERQPIQENTELGRTGRNATDAGRKRRKTRRGQDLRPEEQAPVRENGNFGSWERDWAAVAAELCSVDDGLPARMGRLKLTKAQHRDAQIKAYGNAIVPQVAMQIMEAIKLTTSPTRGIESSKR